MLLDRLMDPMHMEVPMGLIRCMLLQLGVQSELLLALRLGHPMELRMEFLMVHLMGRLMGLLMGLFMDLLMGLLMDLLTGLLMDRQWDPRTYPHV